MEAANWSLLVPIDMSGESERAIEPALRLAHRDDVPVVLFSWSYDVGEASAARRYLNDLAADLPGDVRVEVASTDELSPAPSIVAAAAAERAGATICMAAHGRSGLGHALLGSVAEETPRLAGQPVVLVGPQISRAAIARRPTIVACTDGSDVSASALPVAGAWATRLAVPLQLVRVLGPSPSHDQATDMQALRETGCLAGLGARVGGKHELDVRVLYGDPAEAITSFAGTRAELSSSPPTGAAALAEPCSGAWPCRLSTGPAARSSWCPRHHPPEFMATTTSASPTGAMAEPIELRDGTEVHLHPMRADDAEGLLRFHRRLSPETTYLRFFSVHPELSARELDRFTHVDHRDREAVVATIDEEIVAVARFDRLGETANAEVAFVVADCWQGDGLGTALFDRLARRAREVGVSRFVAEVLPNNRAMLNVFHHAGLPVTTCIRDGVAHLVLDLALR